MNEIFKRITKIQKINNDAIIKIELTKLIFENAHKENYSLNNAAQDLSEISKPENSSDLYISSIQTACREIKLVLDKFNKETFKRITALKKKRKSSTVEILENPLTKVLTEIKTDFGIFYSIEEIRKRPTEYSSDVFNLVNDIEDSYKTILNLKKRITNKFYRTITSRRFLFWSIVLAVASLIVGFITLINFNTEQSATEEIKLKAIERYKQIASIASDADKPFSEKFKSGLDFLSDTFGLLPQILTLITIFIGFVRTFFIKGKKKNKQLKSVSKKISEFASILKESE